MVSRDAPSLLFPSGYPTSLVVAFLLESSRTLGSRDALLLLFFLQDIQTSLVVAFLLESSRTLGSRDASLFTLIPTSRYLTPLLLEGPHTLGSRDAFFFLQSFHFSIRYQTSLVAAFQGVPKTAIIYLANNRDYNNSQDNNSTHQQATPRQIR